MHCFRCHSKKEEDEPDTWAKRGVLWVHLRKLVLVCSILYCIRFVPLYLQDEFFGVDKGPIPASAIAGVDMDHIDVFSSRRTCTVYGKYHMIWEMRMLHGGYVLPTVFFHFILMTAHPFLIEPRRYWPALFAFLVPSTIYYTIVPSYAESASIWCFISAGLITGKVVSTWMRNRELANKQKSAADSVANKVKPVLLKETDSDAKPSSSANASESSEQRAITPENAPKGG